jgi:hypothetical protein
MPPFEDDANTIGLYHLEDTGSTVLDSSSKENHGTHTGMTTGVRAVYGNGLKSTDDNAHHIEIDAIADDFDPTAGTLQFKFAADVLAHWTDGAVHWLANLRTDGNNQIEIIKTAGDTLVFVYTGGGTTLQVGGISPPGDLVPHEYAIEWDTVADELKAFIDGVQVGTTQSGFDPWVGALVSGTIGNRFNNLDGFEGIYDEVRVSDIARGSYETPVTEIEVEYETTIAVTTDFGVAGQSYIEGYRWDFDDGSTQRHVVLYDIFGAANPTVQVGDEVLGPLGSSFNVTPGDQFFVQVSLDSYGVARFSARMLDTDPWTQIHAEMMSDMGLESTRFWAISSGAGAPAWDIEISHDWLRRMIGVGVMGSTLDESYAFGTVADEAFFSILDKLKPSGLKIEVV